MTTKQAKTTLMKIRLAGSCLSEDNPEDALDMAIKALEVYDEYERLKDLNTPKNPMSKDSVWYCPNCKWEMPWGDEYTQHTFDHCTECGQAIDWSN